MKGGVKPPIIDNLNQLIMNKDTKLRITEDIPNIFDEISFIDTKENILIFNILMVEFANKRDITIFFDDVILPDLSAKITKYLLEGFGKDSRHKLDLTVGGIYTINVSSNTEFGSFIFGQEDVARYKSTLESNNINPWRNGDKKV